MPVPSPRNKILPARGNFSDLNTNVASLLDGEICYAIDQDQYYQKEGTSLVAVGATKAQGALADSATQPGDNVSTLTNDAGYITLAEVPADAVTSVAGKTGAVTLVKADITDFSDADYATAAQGALADSATQPGDNVSTLTNDAGYLTAATAPVLSVNTLTGDVSLGIEDMDDFELNPGSPASARYTRGGSSTPSAGEWFPNGSNIARIHPTDADGDDWTAQLTTLGTTGTFWYSTDNVNWTSTVNDGGLDNLPTWFQLDVAPLNLNTATDLYFAFTDPTLPVPPAPLNEGDFLRYDLTDAKFKPIQLGDSVNSDASEFATAAQGALADTAVQPGDLATVATTGSYNDLTDQPTIPPAAPVDSVAGKTGAVTLVKADITDFSDGDYATAAQGTTADSALQPADISVTVQGYDADNVVSDVAPTFTATVQTTERTITAGAFDLSTGNHWTCGAITVPAPTNATAGTSGLIRITAGPVVWNAVFKFPGGTAPTIASFPSIIPFYVQDSTNILMGNVSEGIS